MNLLATSIATQLGGSSMIRRMFEAGNELRKRVGHANVFDFSLGNPDLPPPPAITAALREIAESAREPRAMGYISNGGLPELRHKLALRLAREQQTPRLSADHVIIGCGAAGALNSFFRAILDPGDEVICPAPYFVEYGYYCGHFGGTLKPVPSQEPTFALDPARLLAAIGPRTRVLLLNSPNNPTGAVYSAAALTELAAGIAKLNAGRKRPIYILSDEPYRFLAYDDATVPPILPLSPYAVVIGSFSKQLSIAGERIGYLAISPEMPQGEQLIAAVTMTTRTLGFVNAPIIGQRLALALLDEGVDLSLYAERRALMAAALDAAGIDYTLPAGAFYFFPAAPGGDDMAFVQQLLQQNILAVPGSGFGCPGYFRLSFSVESDFIRRSAPAFARATGLRTN